MSDGSGPLYTCERMLPIFFFETTARRQMKLLSACRYNRRSVKLVHMVKGLHTVCYIRVLPAKSFANVE